MYAIIKTSKRRWASEDRREHEVIQVTDTITGDVITYEDIEDFRTTGKHSFDSSVHDAIDRLADSYKRGECMEPFETYLGIEIEEV